jgi:putative membrane protein
MENFLIKLLISGIVILIAAWLTPGVHIRSFWSALIVALVLSLLNLFLRPLMIVLTIPITIISLGLFLFVINAIMVYLASKMVSGFKIEGFRWALLFSLILSIVSYFFCANDAPVIF